MSALAGRVALVTGSSRGIGAAIAKRFGDAGARVALHGRDADALARTQAEIPGARAFTADVTHADELERMRAAIESELGPVEVLVVNAGGSFEPPCGIEDATEAGWHAAVSGNLTSAFLTLKTFLPGMQQRGRGAVITISSASARRPHVKNPLGYAAAKAGLEQLTQDLALRAGPHGVRVNCIAPETILTARNRERIPENVRASLADAHPLARLGTPEDVADAALFLADNESAWITGAVLDVAGGAVIRR